MTDAAARRRRRADPRVFVGWVIAAVCLFVVLRRLDLATLARQLQHASLRWALAAVACDVASYAVQGCRWSVLLRPTGYLSPFHATQAIYAGLFVNEVMPLRAGEIVRAFVAARSLSRPLARVLPSMVVERLLDGACLAVGIAGLAFFVPLPKRVVAAEELLVIAVAVTAIVLGFVVRGRGDDAAQPDASRPGLRARLADATSGLAGIGPLRTSVAALLSVLFLGLQGLAIWAALHAFGIPLGIEAGVGTALVLRLGTAVPAAPSNLGTYQFATILALRLFGVDATSAAAFSLTGFALLTAPLWAIGTTALAAAGLDLAQVRGRLQAQ